MQGFLWIRPLRSGIWAWIFHLSVAFVPLCGSISVRASIGKRILSLNHRIDWLVVWSYLFINHDGMGINLYRQIPAKCISISIYISKNTLFLSSDIEQISTYPSQISAVFQMVSYTCGGVSFIMAWWTNPIQETRQTRVLQKCAVLTSFLQVVF